MCVFKIKNQRSYGLMDEALVFKTKDSRFNPKWDQLRVMILVYKIKITMIKNCGLVMYICCNCIESVILYLLFQLNAFIY